VNEERRENRFWFVLIFIFLMAGSFIMGRETKHPIAAPNVVDARVARMVCLNGQVHIILLDEQNQRAGMLKVEDSTCPNGRKTEM
jgi:hypothetical protein